METSAREVHENMNAVIDYQTHHRLRETQVSYISVKLLAFTHLSRGTTEQISFYTFVQGHHKAD